MLCAPTPPKTPFPKIPCCVPPPPKSNPTMLPTNPKEDKNKAARAKNIILLYDLQKWKAFSKLRWP